jgi:hypothetical protein
MQSNDTGNEINKPHKQKPWHHSIGVVLILFLISVFSSIFTVTYVISEFNVKPTQLVLKFDGCEFLRQNGVLIELKPGRGDTCKVTLPFRGEFIGSGGVVILDDRQIRLTSSQVEVVASLEGQPLTVHQRRMVFLVVANQCLVFGLLIWLVVLSTKQED